MIAPFWVIVLFCSCSAYKKFSLISLYVTDDALAKFYICDVKFSQIEGMVQKFVT